MNFVLFLYKHFYVDLFDSKNRVCLWSIIIPIFKKGNPNDPGNYRCISLVSHMGKLFTCLLNNKLTKLSENSSVLAAIALSRFNLVIHKSSSFSSIGWSNSSNTVSVVSWFISPVLSFDAKFLKCSSNFSSEISCITGFFRFLNLQCI
jgi:hypothetical protein